MRGVFALVFAFAVVADYARCETVVVPIASVSPTAMPAPAAPDLKALSRQLRVDLVWNASDSAKYEVQRAEKPEGPFTTLAEQLERPFESDFIGEGHREFYYRVRSVLPQPGNKISLYSPWSQVAKGVPNPSNTEDLLTEVQEAGFRYFYDYGHPISGLAREGLRRNPEICAIGASGMGFFNLVVGIERKFITREQGADRAIKILNFLTDKAERFHGAFPHWVNGTTGKAIPFSTYDDGADLVETAFLVQGVIFLREYFTNADANETKIRKMADDLWHGVEWDFFSRGDDKESYLIWHWSPIFAWKKGMRITGFNEAQCAYMLAMASPTHPIRTQCYRRGWESKNNQPRAEFGVPLELGRGLGQSLFFTHYSYLGFDPRQVTFGKKSYFEHFKDLCRVQVLYAASKRDVFTGYGTLWGITASYGPDGYCAFEPGMKDNGTLAPTAALSSMPYVPEESLSCLNEMYRKFGKKLWGPFGFYDAYNFKRDWVSNDVLGIDVGPIAPMIENHRTGLCWNIFMKAPEIRSVIKQCAEEAK